MPLTPAQQAFCDRYLGQGARSRIDGTAALLQQIARIDVPAGATPEEQADLRSRIQRARSLLDESASDRELAYAKGEIDAAAAISAQIVDRLNKARAAAATLQERIAGLLRTLPAETPESLRAPFKAEVDAWLGRLAGAPSTATLREAADALSDLSRRVEEIGEELRRQQATRDAEAQEAAEAAKAAAAGIDPDAGQTARDEVRDLLKAIAEAATPPVSPETLATTRDAAQGLTARLDEIKARMDVLRQIRDAAAPLLARLAPDAPALLPHDRAPAAEVRQIADAAADLLARNAHLTVLAEIDARGLTFDAISGVGPEVDAVEQRMAELNAGTRAAIERLEVAEQAALTLIAKPPGRGFSSTQAAIFSKRVTEALDWAQADLGQADGVIADLTALARDLGRLSAALAAAEKQIDAVTRPDPASLSSKEKARLDALEKAARDALDEVTEP